MSDGDDPPVGREPAKPALLKPVVPAPKPEPLDRRDVKIIVWTSIAIAAGALAPLMYLLIGLLVESEVNAKIAEARKEVELARDEARAAQEALDKKVAELETIAHPPILGILTDFGASSYYIGNLRGRILGELANARIVDISNDIRPLDVRTGAWTLFNAAKTFPEGSIFFAVVNPGADLRKSRLIVTRDPRYFFVGAGDQVFDVVVQRFGVEEAYMIPAAQDDDTFGIQTLAPTVTNLLKGKDTTTLANAHILGKKFTPTPTLHCRLDAEVKADGVHARVCGIDRWGNLLTNVLPYQLIQGNTYSIKAANSTQKREDFIYALSYADGAKHGGVIVRQDGWLQIALLRKKDSDLSAEAAFAAQPDTALVIAPMPEP